MWQKTKPLYLYFFATNENVITVVLLAVKNPIATKTLELRCNYEVAMKIWCEKLFKRGNFEVDDLKNARNTHLRSNLPISLYEIVVELLYWRKILYHFKLITCEFELLNMLKFAIRLRLCGGLAQSSKTRTSDLRAELTSLILSPLEKHFTVIYKKCGQAAYLQ